MKGLNPEGEVAENGSSNTEEESRPGGMPPVQKREDDGGPTIKIKVCHGSNHHDLTVPSLSTFGDLKRVICRDTDLEPKDQRLFFRGKEKEDQECLQMAGLKDNSKLLLMENLACKERKLEELKESSVKSKGSEAVAKVRADNDKLAEQVAALNTVVCDGTKVAEKDIIFLTEMLERQLLKLDGIEAEGEGRIQRKTEVRRVQSLVEMMDDLKSKNSAPISNDVSVTKSDNESVGGIDAQTSLPSSTKVTQDWEVFE
ncbi:hypothetical protein LguiA_016417 [Lonicera macranthoides]